MKPLEYLTFFRDNTGFPITMFLLFLMCVFLQAQDHPGFYVQGRFLYDSCGEKVILRGVANPNIWFQTNGVPQYKEIEKTGANVVRIVWSSTGSAVQLETAIANCVGFSMIPMIENHDATGDWSRLGAVVDYWCRQDILQVIRKHEKYLLLNIANECGDGSVSNMVFKTGYEAAVNKMRGAGIHVPLVIDASGWGQNINILQSQGPALIEADPDHNLLFSVHMWWPRMYGYKESDIAREIEESANMGLPLIVGEFSQMHGSCEEKTITANNSIAYLAVIRECQLHETGYIAWSWFGNCNPFWDMSSDGTYENLYDWGLEVAVTDSFSIQNTSVRPFSIVNGKCKETPSPVSSGFELMPAFPNPFTSNTQIQYRIFEPSHSFLEIFDASGHRVSTLVNRGETAGNYTVSWNGLDGSGFILPSGVYVYRMTLSGTPNLTAKIRKLLLVK